MACNKSIYIDGCVWMAGWMGMGTVVTDIIMMSKDKSGLSGDWVQGYADHTNRSVGLLLFPAI